MDNNLIKRKCDSVILSSFPKAGRGASIINAEITGVSIGINRIFGAFP